MSKLSSIFVIAGTCEDFIFYVTEEKDAWRTGEIIGSARYSHKVNQIRNLTSGSSSYHKESLFPFQHWIDQNIKEIEAGILQIKDFAEEISIKNSAIEVADPNDKFHVGQWVILKNEFFIDSVIYFYEILENKGEGTLFCLKQVGTLEHTDSNYSYEFEGPYGDFRPAMTPDCLMESQEAFEIILRNLEEEKTRIMKLNDNILSVAREEESSGLTKENGVASQNV
jgi:hypothetical protein